MKKVTLLITLLACSVSSYAQHIRLFAEQEMEKIELGFSKNDNPEAYNNFFSEHDKPAYSKEFEIREGEALKPLQLHYLNTDNPDNSFKISYSYHHPKYGDNSSAVIEVKFPESDKWFPISQTDGVWWGLNSSKPIIYGPSKIRLRLMTYNQKHDITLSDEGYNQRAWTQSAGLAWAMLEVVNTFENIQAANNVTVLPQTGANLDLILESSDDLVNWTLDKTGKKPSGNRKRFYRLRAVKE